LIGKSIETGTEQLVMWPPLSLTQLSLSDRRKAHHIWGSGNCICTWDFSKLILLQIHRA
jgi:hypothetical protein